MDSETFEQVAVPEELVGTGKWLLKEGAEFRLRFLDGAVAEVVFPPNFIEEVTDTAEPSVGFPCQQRAERRHTGLWASH